MVQTSQLYAVEAARMPHVQTIRHLRAIYGSARHVDGDSDQLSLMKRNLPECMT